MRRRLFAWFYARYEGALRRETAWIRADLVGDLSGDVLEIGCGTGANFEHYAPEASVLATDASPPMLAYARREAQRARAAIRVEVADATRLPHADASFDVVVGALVLCSVPDPRATLTEIRRVLKPEGQLRLFEHVRSTRRSAALLQRLATPFWGVLMDGCHLDRDTAAAVRACGFRVESEEGVAIPSLPMPLVVIRGRK